MGRNFFERIADMINGTAKKETSEAVSSENTFPNDNSINKKGKLLTAIITAFKSNYLGQQVSFNNKSLTIWVQDNLFYNSIIDSNFKSELATSLNVELGITFGTIEIKSENIPEGELPPPARPLSGGGRFRWSGRAESVPAGQERDISLARIPDLPE